MSIDRETLMAYADGELDALVAKRVEKALAADPALAAEVARHRGLRHRLEAGFAPIAAAPAPDALVAMLRESAEVVRLPVARRPQPRWRAAAAIAATLALGVLLGQALRPGAGDFATRDGTLVASGAVARALDTQLASTQAPDAPVRMLVSFRDAAGAWCRTFETGAQAGLACREGAQWQVRRLDAAGRQASQFRQAGAPAIMAAAQEMMVGAPLDARQERAAAAAGWRR